MDALLAGLTLLIVGYIVGSVKIINQGTEAIVERLGQYRRTLKPGLNFVVPLIDTVLVESTREQTLDIQPQSAQTRDNVTLTIDAIVYWKILQVERAYYSVEDLEEALKNLVITTLRSEVAQLDLSETVAAQKKINQAVLKQLDEAAQSWGIQVLRIEVQEIKLSEKLRQSLEEERVAEAKRKARLSETQGVVESIERISKALKADADSELVLRYLMTEKYVDSNFKLSASPNSKIIFMDPKSLSETIGELIGADTTEGLGTGGEMGDSGGGPPSSS